MPIYLKQSTASQEVPLGHFVDDADGKTAETGLTIANTDIKIWKTGATTLANKNSGGATHISGGVYYAVLDATDTDTVGPLVLFVAVSGALAVRLECVVLEEAMYDWWFGTKVPLSPATAGRDLVVDADGLADANMVKAGPSGSGTAQTAKDIGGAVPAAAAGASGGLLISGSNSGTTTFGALTVTGTTTLAAVTTSGTVTFNAFTVSNATNFTGAVQFGSTWGVTGAITFSSTLASGTITANITGNLTGNVVGTVSTLTTYTGNTPQTGDSFARIGATGSGLTSLASATNLALKPDATEVAQIVYPTHGSVLFVRPSAAGDSGAGTRPTTAKQTLAGAIAAATAGDRIVLSSGVHAVTSETAVPAGVPVQGQEDGRTVIDISTFSNPTTTACLLLQGARHSVTGLHFDDGGTTEYRLVIGNLSGDTAYTNAFLCRNTSTTDTDWLMAGVSGDSAWLIDNHIRSKYDTIRLTGGNGTFDIIGGSYIATGPSGQDSGVRTRNISNAGGGNLVRLLNVTAAASGGSMTNAASDTSGGTTRAFGGSFYATGTGAAAFSQSVVGTVVEVGAAYDPTSTSGTVTQVPRPADVTKISSDATAANNLEAMLDGTGGVDLTVANLTASGTLSANAVSITDTFVVGSNFTVVGGFTGGTISFSTNLIPWNAAYDAEVGDAVWDEAVDGSTTARQSIRLQNSAAGGKASGLGTTNAKFRDLADTKDRIDATVDADGNRSAVTLDLT